MTTLDSMSDLPSLFWLAPAGALAAIILARLIAASVLRKPEGDDEMVRIAAAVREGAMAYLRRQYKVVAAVFIVLIAVLGLMTAMGLQPALSMLGVPLAGFLSALCGWLGMKMATNASARTAFAAKSSLNDGLTIAFRSGAVLGLNVVGFALLDCSLWFILLNSFGDRIGLDGGLNEIATVMLSYGMGASLQALFARVGGGIYTKAADVGADLVGKVEAGIPEDDARNPATIADNVGDNVGDVAGMGADLYESYYGSILATIALGAAAAFTIPDISSGANKLAFALAAAPLALAGIGILCSIVGIFAVKTKEGATFAQLLGSLRTGVYLASALIFLAIFAILFFLLGPNAFAPGILQSAGTTWWKLGLAIVCGLIAGNVIAYATEYYTSYEHPPTRRIAEQALTGPATVIIGGIAEGMKSTWAALLVVVISIIASFTLAGGGENFLMGLYGVAISAVGMLSTLGITLATDAYGPIADNAGGNAEMSGQPPHVRQRTDMLDSLGNTTAATGKGFAIGSAALTALALFAAYIQIVQVQVTTQAESFVAPGCVEYGDYAKISLDIPNKAFAVYTGHGRFAIVDYDDDTTKPYIDGAMLVDRQQLPHDAHFNESVRVGTVFPLDAPSDHHGHGASKRLYHFTVNVGHGDHTHSYPLTIISSRHGTMRDVLAFYDVMLTNPAVLGGLFIGVLLTFLFCALTMSAVGRAAYAMMRECRRQFGIMRKGLRAQGMSEGDIANPERWPKRIDVDGKQYPDYATCVSISTAGAQREMILPSLLALLVPLAVGLTLSVAGVMGMLAGGLTCGFAVAVFMANAGGAWDNAKKLLESFGRISAADVVNNPDIRRKIPAGVREAITAKAEEMVRTGRGESYAYGKGSDDHKATVVGDTVGDPFKDTSGPSLNILIKLISIVSVVFAGLVVKYGPIVGEWLGLN